MGRGLSDLQKAILVRAWSNRRREGRTSDSKGTDVYTCEILMDHFGWPLPPRFYERTCAEPPFGEPRHRFCTQHVYSRREIGEARYSAAHAAVHRAIRRLEGRGLAYAVRGHAKWSGADLTDLGIEVAAGLSVNHVSDGTLLSR